MNGHSDINDQFNYFDDNVNITFKKIIIIIIISFFISNKKY